MVFTTLPALFLILMIAVAVPRFGAASLTWYFRVAFLPLITLAALGATVVGATVSTVPPPPPPPLVATVIW